MLRFGYTKIKFFGKWARFMYHPFIIYPFSGKNGYVFLFENKGNFPHFGIFKNS